MSDAPTRWLIQQIQQHSTTQSLWLSDENVLHELPDAQHWPQKPQLISNRWDITTHAEHLGFRTTFCDFNLSPIEDASLDHIFYRISKEKPITHHLINEAHRLLKPSGSLWLCGQKNEGIKTYIEKACLLFNTEKHIEKNGMNYSSQLIKNTTTGGKLNDEDYHRLRPTHLVNEHQIISKPGQFGWNKIDQGSAFLIDELANINSLSNRVFDRCLDLGCGYGYLTIASQFLHKTHCVLTDNNAAALISAAQNCNLLAIDAQVIVGDAGKQLNGQFDLILCNPPFHQGFGVDGDLTLKFLQSAHRLLRQDGVAYFVTNQFIPLEKKAQDIFKNIQKVAGNKSFNLFSLAHN